jgi:translocation and assembly module TamB
LHLTEGGFLLMADGRRYQNIAIDAKLTPDALKIEQLQASTMDGGRVRVTGKADLVPGPRLTALDLRVVAERFGVAVSGNLVGTVNGQLRVTGKMGPNGLDGTVRVEKGSVRMPAFAQSKDLQSTDPLADVVYVDARGRRRVRPAGEEPMPVHLGVRLSKPLELRGPEINTDLSGQIDVQMHGDDVRLTGSLETASGWIDVFGHRFTIDHVRVGFAGGQTIDPTLDIRVTRQRGDALLAVDVSGTMAKPHIDLSSDPAIYNESEILALIISDDPSAQGGDRASLNDKIVGAISGLLVSKLKQQIAPQLPIDVIKVDVGGGGGGPVGVGQTRIEVGKFVTPKLYLSYVHQFGQPNVLQPRNSNQATVEWRFAPRWQLEVTYGDANVGAADVFFRLRF